MRAARDKGRLSAACLDLGCCGFPDAWPAADSRPGRPQRPPPAAPGQAAPGGRKWGGARAAPSQLSLLSPEGMSADFLKPDPGRPPARPPLTWTGSPGNSRRGAGAHLGGRGQVLFPLNPPSGLVQRKGGWVGGNQPLSLLPSGDLGDRPTPPASVSPSAKGRGVSLLPDAL